MSVIAAKVLVVDDEPPIRKLLRMGLTVQGYQILEAPNGKTALELLSQGPDLVILDLELPDIQGHELLRMIRARNENVPLWYYRAAVMRQAKFKPSTSVRMTI
jgi:two-component system, OmpR family, KDP operon response regulator KdpE